MAIATVVEDTQKFELKSAPPDGYVVIRRMTYGEKLKLKSMMSGIRMDLADKRTGQLSTAHIEIFEEKVSAWEFANLVTDHNLTDANQKLLNFKNVADVNRLNGQVGEEISDLIKKVNDFEEEEEVKN